ncbi:MAG TPA: glycosyltransferase family 4 protein [bacterium]|nr:glycosyltransferase family 4 protein [bacterium]HNM14402.1 glycosyltransferase family 4 protein [bacterium]
MKYLPASGGTATYAHNLAQGLARMGHDVLLVSPDYARPQSDDGLPYRVIRLSQARLGLGQFRIFLTAYHTKKILNNFNPDVIWASTYAGCRVLGLLRLRIPTVGTIHGGGIQRAFSSLNPIKRCTDHAGWRFMRRASAMITVSEEAKKLVCSAIQDTLIQSKFRVIYNGIDFDPSSVVSKKEALSRWPQFEGRIILLTVGRLVKAKGHDVVIRALPEIQKRVPNILYVIAGEGVEKEQLINLVESLSLKNSVHFTGYITPTGLEELYAISDLFVLAGRWTPTFVEGFGLVLVEAAIRGKPVIGARIGGIPEAIEDGVSGIVIEPEDPSQVAKAVMDILSDQNLYDRMAKAGPVWVNLHFTQAIMARNIDQLLCYITGKS